MKELRLFFMLAVAIFVLAACSDDEKTGVDPENGENPGTETPQDDSVKAQFSAKITDFMVTRVMGKYWSAGDLIGISGSLSASSLNIKYVADAQGGISAVTSENEIYVGKEETFTAYYPFAGTEKSSGGIIEKTITVADQSSEMRAKIDFLYAEGVTASSDYYEIGLKFVHKMSKLSLKFKSIDGVDLTKMTSYTLKGIKMNGAFNTSTGDITVSGDATDLMFTTTNSTAAEYSDTLILFPQTLDAALVTVNLNGRNYDFPIKLDGLGSAKNYIYEVEVTDQQVLLADVKAAIVEQQIKSSVIRDIDGNFLAHYAINEDFTKVTFSSLEGRLLKHDIIDIVQANTSLTWSKMFGTTGLSLAVLGDDITLMTDEKRELDVRNSDVADFVAEKSKHYVIQIDRTSKVCTKGDMCDRFILEAINQGFMTTIEMNVHRELTFTTFPNNYTMHKVGERNQLGGNYLLLENLGKGDYATDYDINIKELVTMLPAYFSKNIVVKVKKGIHGNYYVLNVATDGWFRGQQ